jgi:hypothetical protein
VYIQNLTERDRTSTIRPGKAPSCTTQHCKGAAWLGGRWELDSFPDQPQGREHPGDVIRLLAQQPTRRTRYPGLVGIRGVKMQHNVRSGAFIAVDCAMEPRDKFRGQGQALCEMHWR